MEGTPSQRHTAKTTATLARGTVGVSVIAQPNDSDMDPENDGGVAYTSHHPPTAPNLIALVSPILPTFFVFSLLVWFICPLYLRI